MRERLKKQYSIKSIVVITIVLLLTVSIAMSLSFLYSFRIQTQQNKKDLYISSMETISMQLDDKAKEIIWFQRNLCSLDITRSFAEKEFAGNGVEIINQYISIKGANSYIENIILVHNNGTLFNCIGDARYNSEITLNIGNYRPTGFVNSELPKYVVTSPIYDTGYEHQIAKMVFIINPSTFLNEINSANVANDAKFVIAYDTNPIKALITKGYIKNMPDNWMFTNYNTPELNFNFFDTAQEELAVTQVTLEEYGIIVYMLLPSKALAAGWPENVVFYFILWCGSVILILTLLMRLFSAMRFSSRKIEELLGSIGNGETQADTAPLPINEFRDVADSIITMTDTINILSNKNLLAEKQLLEQELANRKAVLSSLKNQINPHFIYNTLSCVKNMGMEYDDSRIAEICDSIIQILRYSIKDAPTATVKEEIEALESYLFIQSCRFKGRFDYKISVEDSIMSCQMLRFLLQPILENAIVHGISPKKTTGKIIISGKVRADKIVFDISDTGIGMPPYVLENINRKLEENISNNDDDDGHGIGLSNINSRLKLFYGEQCSFKINSVLNMGTFITISFPKLDN